uniref:PUM-HD domain-containing protein n=1 Tax=Lactuca sativa TaxID=4236 RepID=A0A9R1UR72_LACSA|nr:hypothetical protein LSAT_V11C800397730 [Lactuca sativa]
MEEVEDQKSMVTSQIWDRKSEVQGMIGNIKRRKAKVEEASGDWNLQPRKKYFFIRNYSTIVVFAIGKKYIAGNGFHIVGAHTDSPCLKLKPVSKVSKGGYLEVGVQTYGGGLWYTWFDRDLTIARRMIIKEGKGDSVSYSHKLSLQCEFQPLAIHLDRGVNDGFKVNAQTHLAPVLATAVKAELNKKAAENGPDGKPNESLNSSSIQKHHSLLLQILVDKAGCRPDEICDFELQACDTQPSIVAGAMQEFVFSGRLDNLCMSFCSLKKVVMSVVKPVIAMSVVKGCFSSSVYEFANLESSRICNQVDNFMDLSSQIPARYSAPINHLASASALNIAGKGQFLRRCNYPPISNFHSPIMGSRHANLPLGCNNFVVSHGHEDMQALQKVYLEALLAQHDQQYSSPLFGRSGSLNHLYGNPTYNHGIPYQGNLLENSTRSSVGSRQLSQQFAPAFRNSVGGVSGSWNSEGDMSLDKRYVSSLLDELKNNKNKSFELSDVVDHVIEFSTDQYGSRFIQQKLESATVEEKNIIFPEIVPHARSLMTDFFEHGTKSQRRELAGQLIGHVLPLSLQMYGFKVIQKALEVVEVDQQTEMVAELDGSIMKCNGNHVIQKCIECVPQDRVQFIVSSFFRQVVSLSSHPYGCRVIQRVLEHCDDRNTQAVMDEITNSVCTLAQEQYGNYVIQHVLQHGKPHERSAIINKISGEIVKMSLQKFASHVVVKCLTYGSPDERQLLVNEMLGSTDENEPLQAMMKDPFGNYVVQKVLETCDDQTRELILYILDIFPLFKSFIKFSLLDTELDERMHDLNLLSNSHFWRWP